MVSHFDKLPKEIVDKINSMNPEHREKMNKNIDNIEIAGILKRLKYVDNGWTDILTIDDPDYFVTTLNKCKCCIIHQKKKPTSLCDIGDYRPFYDAIVLHDNNSCYCYCRHYSRQLYFRNNQREAAL
jgi:hypothetical protein